MKSRDIKYRSICTNDYAITAEEPCKLDIILQLCYKSQHITSCFLPRQERG